MNQLHLNNILKKIQQNFKDFKLIGSLQKKFQIQFDQTLKITDYRLEASGNIQKSKIKLQEPQKYLFVKNEIKNIELEKSEFQINYNGNKENSLNVNGTYKINDNLFQKFNFKQLEKFNSKKISIDVNFDDEIDIPILNYNSKNQVININTVLQIKKIK